RHTRFDCDWSSDVCSSDLDPDGGWQWGSNGLLLNNLVVIANAHRLSGRQRYLDAGETGIDYLLGRNALGQSYVAGYGIDSSRQRSEERRVGKEWRGRGSEH